MKQQSIQDILQELFNKPNQGYQEKNKKMLSKKRTLLLKIPLFHLIYQKKGPDNFNTIVEHLRLLKMQFGDVVFDEEAQRTFNYVLRGSVLLYGRDLNNKQKCHRVVIRSIGPNGHFGEKTLFNNKELQCAKVTAITYLLQLDLPIFINTFQQHFQFTQLKDRVIFLKTVWAFANIKRTTLQNIVVESPVHRYTKGHRLFRVDEVPEHAFVFLQGSITLVDICRKREICILSKGDVCGIEEILDNAPFQSEGICNTQFVEVMLIKSAKVLSLMEGEADGILKTRKIINNQLKNSRLEQSSKSINLAETRADIIKSRRVRTELSNERNVFTIDYKVMSKYKGRSKSNLERTEHCEEGRLAKKVNANFTRQKQLLYKYLVKKNKNYNTMVQQERQYLAVRLPLMRELQVQKSLAVKNQKRKMKHSRRKQIDEQSIDII